MASNNHMYLVLHTVRLTSSLCELEAHFVHALRSPGASLRLLARRLTLRASPKPTLKSINKRSAHINHHIRAIRICGTAPKQDDAPPAAAVPPAPTAPLLLPEQRNGNVDVNKQSVSAEFSVSQTAHWLSCNRFSAYLQTFQGFSGADMLRMSKDDLMQICGQADGIRLFNALHSKSIAPKLTMYVCRDGSTVFHAIYLAAHASSELCARLCGLLGVGPGEVRAVWMQGPHGIHVTVTDDVLRHIKDDAMFALDLLPDCVIVLKPIVK